MTGDAGTRGGPFDWRGYWISMLIVLGIVIGFVVVGEWLGFLN